MSVQTSDHKKSNIHKNVRVISISSYRDETEGRTSVPGHPPAATRYSRSFTDELDARGTFKKEEVRRELRRLNRFELEGNLGLSSHKVDEILNRAEKKSKQKIAKREKLQPGEIKYKVFLGKTRNLLKLPHTWRGFNQNFSSQFLKLKFRKITSIKNIWFLPVKYDINFWLFCIFSVFAKSLVCGENF